MLLLVAAAAVAAVGTDTRRHLQDSSNAADTVTIFVHPSLGSDGADSGATAEAPLRTLLAARARLRWHLKLNSQRPQNVVVELMAGSHRVPRGGLLLTAEDSPAPGGSTSVVWRGAPNGTASVSGGEAVAGWRESTDPDLPASARGKVWAAPAPAHLPPSGNARHLYVDGARAVRTRVNASEVLGSAPGHPGTADLVLEKSREDCPACSYAAKGAGPARWLAPEAEFLYPAGMAEARCAVEAIALNVTSNSTRQGG
jgi:hypothetical protein